MPAAAPKDSGEVLPAGNNGAQPLVTDYDEAQQAAPAIEPALEEGPPLDIYDAPGAGREPAVAPAEDTAQGDLDVDALIAKLPASHVTFVEERLRGHFIGARKIDPDSLD